jgi:hypothetical protein
LATPRAHGRVRAAVGDVIPFEEIVRMRRQRVARAYHARCMVILAASVEAARVACAELPARERWVCVARLRKLEELEAYAASFG